MARGARPGVPGPRRPLSRDRIIRAALLIIDEEGVEALSMRRIAARLGVQAMSLYNHVRGKDDILDGVTEFITGDMRMPRRMAGGWEEGIRDLSYGFRRASLRHPRACEMVLMRQLSTRTALAPVDTMIAMMLDHGFDEEIAVRVLRLFVSFQVGTLLQEVRSGPGSGRETRAPEERLAARAAYFAGSGFPAVAKVAPILAVNDHEAEFAFGVELLISALRDLAPVAPD
ncbi:TetR/AcrR family transcriptional regulator C-terminal domain-containing protein [Streptomyces spongiicola]|uniref:TetR/AcrR family transcriptional regulator C-terminal domain-containing protein n=1 Tax=Streptomyces spongiicola TaxID=1690221 RepID=UPI001FEB0EE8|nr:TetR/AcrR family transcriptional regulator C-terminal domain-containing protein [Streptomyces spongiicola]